ncbi:MAG: carbamoyltransferase, partial [Armatimonadetes bacterium]|nr:carbamoyltransferase [Armatimonadota bacterium]
MIILGLNAYHGDASAALFIDGRLVAAAEEERFTRVKHAAGFPAAAVRYCLREAGVEPAALDHVAVARRPWSRFLAKAGYALRMPKFAASRGRVVSRVRRLRAELARALDVAPDVLRAPVRRVEHHRAHLASSFYVSPFETAAVMSADGLGDFASFMWGMGRGNAIEARGEVIFPHSLGLFYTALTQYLGFWKYGDEYKVMGLAAMGEPAYAEEFRRIVRTDGDLRFALGLDYFIHHRQGLEMSWEEGEPVLSRLFSPYMEERLGPARQPGAPVDPRHAHIAASLQLRLEEVLFALLNALHERVPVPDLCLAGGIAMNCVANGKIFDRTPFRRLYIQPAAGDAGLAIGSALETYHRVSGGARGPAMQHAYWGPQFATQEIRAVLERHGLPYREMEEAVLVDEVAARIAEGKIVGWFQGRSEWGPRALGHRSILADPTRKDMQDHVNLRVKHREDFRPFAPSATVERFRAYFDTRAEDPFMVTV